MALQRKTQARLRREAAAYIRSFDFLPQTGVHRCAFEGDHEGYIDCRCSAALPRFMCLHPKINHQATYRRFHKSAAGPSPSEFVFCNLCPRFSTYSSMISPEQAAEILWYADTRRAPDRWWEIRSIQEGFRQILSEVRRDLQSVSVPEKHGEAILYCAGGRYSLAAYVSIRLVRHLGCTLPIEVWHLEGEISEGFRRAVEPYGVTFVDGSRFPWQIRPSVPLGGWQLKAHALLCTGYRWVLYMDADCYPVHNPEMYFQEVKDRGQSALFFPDVAGTNLSPETFALFGIEYPLDPQWETGMFLVDTVSAYRPIWYADQMNKWSDYCYRFVYGDKETFHLAFRALGYPVDVIPHRPAVWHGALAHYSWDRQPWFVHRIGDKVKVPGDIGFVTRQMDTMLRYTEGLPHEELVHRFYAEGLPYFACPSQENINGNRSGRLPVAFS